MLTEQAAAPEAATDGGNAPAEATVPETAGDAVNAAFAAYEESENETNAAADVLKNGANEEGERGTQQVASADDAVKADDGTKSGPARDANGRFVKKTEAGAPETSAEGGEADASADPAGDKAAPDAVKYEPPTRFTKEAKEAWAKAPPEVQAEVDRAVKELESGLGKYKEQAEAFSKLERFADMAREYKVELPEMMENFIAFDRLAATDLVGAVDALAQAQGVDVKQLAEHILGQTPETRQAQSRWAEIQQENARLKEQLAERERRERRQTEEQKRSQAERNQQIVEEFKGQNPRFAELEEHVVDILFNSKTFERTGDLSVDLPKAFERAERLNPLPRVNASSPVPQVAPSQQPAQTRKTGLSISGAPGPGSNPAGKRTVPHTPDAAVDDAWNQIMGN